MTLDVAAAAALARALGDAVCLSTCNRTEVYLAGGDEDARRVAALEQLAGEPLDAVLYRLHDDEAALHLFRVAAGLDSLVPGEGEILGQVRAAYEPATPGPLLDRVFRQALERRQARADARRRSARAPPRSRRRRPRSRSRCSATCAAARVLLVGAGRIGELAAANLVVARRRRSPSSRTARATPRASSRDALRRRGADARRVAGEARRGRRRRLARRARPTRSLRASDVPVAPRTPLFFIDIAVPRDLDPAIAELDGCFLYDIDDLEAVVAETLAGRRAEAERAEQLVAEEADRFRAWRASLDVVPAIASLRARAEAIRCRGAREARRAASSDEERRTLESVTAQILNKLLHLPTVRMKEAAVSADGAVYADAVRHLFGLEDE